LRPNGDGSAEDLTNADPFPLFTDEVKNSYLRCSYKWSFHHIPTLLNQVRKGTLDSSVLWAILALAIRYTCPDIQIIHAMANNIQLLQRCPKTFRNAH
jgi:hypothetical protein